MEKCLCGNKLMRISNYLTGFYWCDNCGRICDTNNLYDLEDTWYKPKYLSE